MFTQTAEFYDAIYSFKDYVKEGEYLKQAIQHHRAGAQILLDVACGTGKHLVEFTKWISCEGLDLDANLLAIARQRLPQVPCHLADMRQFDLGRQFDVITCLFSSIGYAKTGKEMADSLGCFHRHLKPHGIVLIEPWLYPENYKSPHLHLLTVDRDDLKIARVSRGERIENVSVIDFEYLVVDFEKTERFQEHHELGLFSQGEYEAALQNAGFTVEYDPIGPMGRGMFIGIKE